MINKYWILLDIGSTTRVCCNKYFIDKTKDCHEHEWSEIVTNGGSHQYTKMSLLKLFPMKVNYNTTSPAIIICLKDAASLNGVTGKMDTSKEHAIKP